MKVYVKISERYPFYYLDLDNISEGREQITIHLTDEEYLNYLRIGGEHDKMQTTIALQVARVGDGS
jgi:hypothetical protein